MTLLHIKVKSDFSPWLETVDSPSMCGQIPGLQTGLWHILAKLGGTARRKGGLLGPQNITYEDEWGSSNSYISQVKTKIGLLVCVLHFIKCYKTIMAKGELITTNIKYVYC